MRGHEWQVQAESLNTPTSTLRKNASGRTALFLCNWPSRKTSPMLEGTLNRLQSGQEKRCK